MRFVRTSLTGVGVGDLVRSAVAAAEAERLAFDGRLARKANAAALCAEEDGLTLLRCEETSSAQSASEERHAGMHSRCSREERYGGNSLA